MRRKPAEGGDPRIITRIVRACGMRQAESGEAYSWSDLARDMGWTPSPAGQVRRAERPLRIKEVEEIATLLGVSPGWLAYGEGAPQPVQATTPPFEDVPVEKGLTPEEIDERGEADHPRRAASAGLPAPATSQVRRLSRDALRGKPKRRP